MISLPTRRNLIGFTLPLLFNFTLPQLFRFDLAPITPDKAPYHYGCIKRRSLLLNDIEFKSACTFQLDHPPLILVASSSVNVWLLKYRPAKSPAKTPAYLKSLKTKPSLLTASIENRHRKLSNMV